MLLKDREELNLDPTHQRKFDIGFHGMRYDQGQGKEVYESIDAIGWRRLCSEGYYGNPCDCQEMSCDQ